MDPSSVRRRSSVGREPGWKTSGRNICAAQPAFSSRRTRFASGLAGEAFQKLRGESTAVADAVRRELEEGMSRLEEIPVPDMQTLDSYPGTLAQRNRRTERDFPVWSGLSREKSSAWPRQDKGSPAGSGRRDSAGLSNMQRWIGRRPPA